MKIEIKKVKLTKSIISQMYFINIKDIEKAKVLGTLVNARKGYPKLMLLEFEDDYYVCDMRWECGENSFYYSVLNKGTVYKRFNSRQECKNNWMLFTRAREKALKTHIYI